MTTPLAGFATRFPMASREDIVAALRVKPEDMQAIFTEATKYSTGTIRTNTIQEWLIADSKHLEGTFIFLLTQIASKNSDEIEKILHPLPDDIKQRLTDLLVSVSTKNPESLIQETRKLFASKTFSLEQKKQIYGYLLENIPANEKLKLTDKLPQNAHAKFVLLTIVTTLLSVKTFQSSEKPKIALLVPTAIGAAFVIGSCLNLQKASDVFEITIGASVKKGISLFKRTSTELPKKTSEDSRQEDTAPANTEETPRQTGKTPREFLSKHKKYIIGGLTTTAIIGLGAFLGYTYLNKTPAGLQLPALPEPVSATANLTPPPPPRTEETTIMQDICHLLSRSRTLQWVNRMVETEYQSPLSLLPSGEDFRNWVTNGMNTND